MAGPLRGKPGPGCFHHFPSPAAKPLVKPPQGFREFFGEEETPMANIRYGMASDLRKGVGGHSCSVACKRENAVSLGGGRPWVKESNKGPDPHSRQSFLPLSGNICENPICIHVCRAGTFSGENEGIAPFDPPCCLGCRYGLAVYPYKTQTSIRGEKFILSGGKMFWVSSS